jgi:hypothetical protein
MKKRENRNTSTPGSKTPSPPAKPVDQGAGVLYRAIETAEAGRCEKALGLLRKAAGRDDRIVNAIGVCLLRLGRYDEAIELFRRLVLAPGCTWMRPVPIAYKTNYATALLLGRHPAGCVDILGELACEENPTVQALRSAIKRWESQLSFWQRLNWRFGQIEPRNCQVSIDVTPGDFGLVHRPTDLPRPAGYSGRPRPKVSSGSCSPSHA